MPEHAGESPATGADVSAPGGDGRTGRRPLSSVGLRRDAHLVGRLRRAGVVGCAALLLGVSVLTNAGPAPSPVKDSTGEFLKGTDLRLEAAPPPPPEKAGVSAASGLRLVSRQLETAKSEVEPSAETPVCVSYPIEPGRFRLTSPYGYRVHPIFGTWSMHTGNDYAAPLGTPIHALTDGTVVYTGPGRLGRSSELVIIEHEVAGHTFYSWYVHMYPDGVFVEPGQRVRAGEVIAEVGNNGNSTGPHLHFEIHISDAIGLEKTAPPKTPTSLVLRVVPKPDPSDDPSFGLGDPDPEPTDEPTDGEPTEEPTDGEPTEEPTDGEPTEEPTDGEPTEESTDGEPTEEPTDGEPTEEPTDGEPTEEPTDGATPTPEPSPTPEPTPTPEPSPTPAPTPEPTAEPTEEPSDEPSEEPTDEPGERESRPRTPFPTRAYGTTVDPVSFLASLGLTMVAPGQCTTP